jgi:ribosome modulation factor
MRIPYVRPWYRRLFCEGVAAGRDATKSRAVCPQITAFDRRPWLLGFAAGRAELRHRKG